MKKGLYNKPKTRKPILSPYNPDSQMVILETELYKPLINSEIKNKAQCTTKCKFNTGGRGS
jgi:hypothetical protein